MHGNATILGGLTVDGWLQAPNIAEPCKGVFGAST